MKDAFYFSHDSNARNDTKILALRSVYGLEGYGRYWVIVEMMREESDYKIMLTKYVWNAVALQMQCSASDAQQFVEDCINEFHLFESDGKAFWSTSLLRRMVGMDDKREKARKAANARWDKERCNTECNSICDSNADAHAGAMPSSMHSNASKVNKSKVNQSRVDKNKENNKTIRAREDEPVDNFSDGLDEVAAPDESSGDESAGDDNPDFMSFWNAYPKRMGMPRAMEAWRAMMDKGVNPKYLVSAAKKYALEVIADKTEMNFVKMPHNFLLEKKFYEYLPRNIPECPRCHGEGNYPDDDGSVIICDCRKVLFPDYGTVVAV